MGDHALTLRNHDLAVTLRGRLEPHSVPTFGSGNDHGQIGEVGKGLPWWHPDPYLT